MSKIEWLHQPGTKPEVWNPVTGCAKVSAGCRNCYAERFANRRMAPEWRAVADNLIDDPRSTHPSGQRLRRFSDVLCHEDRLDLPLRWTKPRTVFVNSMSDLFHEAVPDEFIDRVFAVMALAPRHRFIVLSKRPQRMCAYVSGLRARTAGRYFLPALFEHVACIAEESHGEAASDPWFKAANAHAGKDGWPLPNVILGVSVEDQATADERIPLLLQTPAAVRVVSYEPALGQVDFEPFLQYPPCHDNYKMTFGASEWRGIDWLIVGGESGPQARPCDVAWVRSAVQQTKAAGVKCFVKQLGANPVDPSEDGVHDTWGPVRHPKGGDMTEWPADTRVREWPR